MNMMFLLYRRMSYFFFFVISLVHVWKWFVVRIYASEMCTYKFNDEFSFLNTHQIQYEFQSYYFAIWLWLMVVLKVFVVSIDCLRSDKFALF